MQTDNSLYQFNSEQHIFDSQLSVHLPDPDRYSLKLRNTSKRTRNIVEPRIWDMTTKSLFDVALDNVTFISTLDKGVIWDVNDIRTTELSRRFSSESTSSILASSVSSTETQDERICETIKEEEIPIWVDKVKMKENPTRYEHAIEYLNKAEISFNSALPLMEPCRFYFIDNNKQSSGNYLSFIRPLFDCDTVWNFTCQWRSFNCNLMPNQSLGCFIKSVKPIWEDQVNQKGGRLNIPVSCDDAFQTVLMAFIGGNLFMFGTVGIVLSKRHRNTCRIEIWLNGSATNDKISELKTNLQSLLPNEGVQTSQFKKHFL
ncbi:hypothetical protein G6F50_001899 [Rhizopus delemar]|nr:hypothetical protein G6F50_001899 [Rhizopus delemar]